VRKDLAACFRETLILKINKDFSSLQSMMKNFPRRILIYGRNKHARKFAAEQYHFHFEQLLGVLASAGGTLPDPPAILTIPESQVREVQEANIDRVAELTAKVDKANVKVYKDGYLTSLIERHKKQSNMNRKIEEESAESIGYIIDLGLEELTPAEFSELDSGELRKYIRFSCDGQEGTDFESSSHHAKTQRILFFKRLLDTLLDMPAFDLSNPFASPGKVPAKAP
jgi:hypothetical protein